MKRLLSLATVCVLTLSGQAYAKSDHKDKDHHSSPPVHVPDMDFHFDHHPSHDFDPPCPQVPEPETYALVAAGLGVVGMSAWRRKRR